VSGLSLVIVAAGSGARLRASLGSASVPRKAFVSLLGRPLLRWTLEALSAVASVDEMVVVLHPEDLADSALVAELQSWGASRLVAGGERRQDSVLNGLRATRPGAERMVGVHDAARVLVAPEDVERTLVAACEFGAAVLVGAVRDTVKEVDGLGLVTNTHPREKLRLAQTPQIARRTALLAALEAGGEFSDEAMALEAAGVPVGTVLARCPNPKITTAEDLVMVEAIIGTGGRIGHGYDLHRLVPGRPLMLGGLHIPYEKGLLGHSDGDVVLHALVDAMLGAAGLGDIGELFPDTDASFAGAASEGFVLKALEELGDAGFLLLNVDITIHAERPKLGPWKTRIRRRIAELLGLPEDLVNVKATTREGLGDIGEGRAICATAVVSARGPGSVRQRIDR